MSKLFTAIIHKEDKLYVAECPEVGTASQGYTIEEAIENLKEATEVFLEEFPAESFEPPFGGVANLDIWTNNRLNQKDKYDTISKSATLPKTASSELGQPGRIQFIDQGPAKPVSVYMAIA